MNSEKELKKLTEVIKFLSIPLLVKKDLFSEFLTIKDGIVSFKDDPFVLLIPLIEGGVFNVQFTADSLRCLNLGANAFRGDYISDFGQIEDSDSFRNVERLAKKLLKKLKKLTNAINL